MKVVVVLTTGNDSHATPLPVDFRYCPLVPVELPTLTVPVNIAFPVVNVSVSVSPVTSIPFVVVSNFLELL